MQLQLISTYLSSHAVTKEATLPSAVPVAAGAKRDDRLGEIQIPQRFSPAPRTCAPAHADNATVRLYSAHRPTVAQ